MPQVALNKCSMAKTIILHHSDTRLKCTWTGGFRAVGKTAASAMQVYERCKRYEGAGAFGVEIEVVPPEVTAEVSKHTSLFLVSMGAEPVATASIFLPVTFWAAILAMCRGTPSADAMLGSLARCRLV